MRLSCPNCGAQYEVPLEVIPRAGRDVQCSNCGHTWFQIHPDQDVELAAEVGGSIPDQGWMPQGTHADDIVARESAEDPAVHSTEDEVQPPEVRFDDDESKDVAEPEHSPEREPAKPEAVSATQADEGPETYTEADTQTGTEAGTEDGAEDGSDDDSEDDSDQRDVSRDVDADSDFSGSDASESDRSDEDDPVAASTPPRRKAIDSAVADVLRQEAEHEVEAREADTREALETQPELGLDAGFDESGQRTTDDDDKTAKATARKLRIQGLSGSDTAPVLAPEADTAAHQSRRDLLPDIEEINSTLRSTDDRNAGDTTAGAVPHKARRRNGFRLGIVTMLLLATVLVLTYAYNRQITAAYPATKPAISAYMVKMNGARVWLDTAVTGGMLWLNDQAEASGSDLK